MSSLLLACLREREYLRNKFCVCGAALWSEKTYHAIDRNEKLNLFLNWHERLREERERLGMSQTALGEIGGVKKQTQIAYEQGKNSPDLRYLEAVSSCGMDVRYVLTGERQPSGAELNDDYADIMARAQRAFGVGSFTALGMVIGLKPHELSAVRKSRTVPWAQLLDAGRREGIDLAGLLSSKKDGELKREASEEAAPYETGSRDAVQRLFCLAAGLSPDEQNLLLAMTCYLARLSAMDRRLAALESNQMGLSTQSQAMSNVGVAPTNESDGRVK
jgi:transcriptional regulator with XRE-family HTH domain